MDKAITFCTTMWLYEDIINDILKLRTQVILDPNGRPYRYCIDFKSLFESADGNKYESMQDIAYGHFEIGARLSKYRNDIISNQKRYDKTKTVKGSTTTRKKQPMDIIYHAVAVLAKTRNQFLDEPDTQCTEKEIADYYKEFHPEFLDDLQHLYYAYDRYDKDMMIQLLQNKSIQQKLLHDVMAIVPDALISTMYIYFCYHNYYAKGLFDAFYRTVNPLDRYTEIKSVVDIEMKLEQLRAEMDKDDTLKTWHKEIYLNATQTAVFYPSIKAMIPKKSHIKALMKAIYKKWEKQEPDRWEFFGPNNPYIEEVKKDVHKRAICIIHKNGETSPNTKNSINLRTLYNSFYPIMENLFQLTTNEENNAYTYPDFLQKVYFRQVENVYHSKIKKRTETYHQNDPDKERMSKLYIVLFISCAFDERITIDNSDDRAQSILKWLQEQLKANTVTLDDYEKKYIKKKLIKEILDQWGK